MTIATLPSLPLGYADGITMLGYAPFIAWFVVTGLYLVRGGTERSISG
jgi:hypothetical protein